MQPEDYCIIFSLIIKYPFVPLLRLQRIIVMYNCRIDKVKFYIPCVNINYQQVNKVSNSGRTALHEASLAGQTDVVRVLLDAGSNFETKDDDGDTALMCAIFR